MTMLAVAGSLALMLAPGGETDRGAKIVTTTLEKIRETPESYKGVWVTFPVQFAWAGRLQNPFFTRFVATKYANFQCWGDAQEIWQKEQYDNVYALLFMDKENERLEDLFQLKTYQRIQVTGVVRNTFQGQPWIEMTEFEVLDGRVNTATLAHMFRGEQHMANRRWKMAISELSLAPADGVPDTIRAAVHKGLGICYLKVGEASPALHHLETAVDLYGDATDPEADRLLKIALSDPSLGLDRAINRQAVKDHERPMWEAFAPATPDGGSN